MSTRLIDYSRLRSLTTREIVNALQRDGFEYLRTKGSHQHFHHEDGRLVTVADHSSGGTYSIRTLRSMIEDQAYRTMDDLRRLGLL